MNQITKLIISLCLLVGVSGYVYSSVPNNLPKEKIAIENIDKKSMAYGACIQAYVCQSLHEQGTAEESLYEIELRLGKEKIEEFTFIAQNICR